MMEEKLYNLIQERGPWLLKKNLLSKSIFKFLKNYLKFDETIFVGNHIQTMTGQEAFNWLGSEYTSNCEVKGLDNIPADGKCLIVSNHPMGAADAIALYYQIFKIRQDSFFFANELFVYLLGAFDEVIDQWFGIKRRRHIVLIKLPSRGSMYFLTVKDLELYSHLEDCLN